MDHKREADRKSDATEPSPPPHDAIEPDPMNPVTTAPDAEPKTPERPDLDWGEHED
jgi:hypothetical protein